jgi:hypothetical protein
MEMQMGEFNFGKMKVALRNLSLLLPGLLGICLGLYGQGETPTPKEPAPVKEFSLPDEPQFGIRFGYQLQFPSKNYVHAVNYSFFEAGHHLAYGAYINLKADQGVQFSPYFGLEHVFWPKSEGYGNACDLDSFPTFMAVDDTVPGRDFRFFNLVFEPALKFYIRRMSLFLKLQPMFAYNIQSKVEQYAHTCGVPLGTQFVDYVDAELRDFSKFTVSVGAGIVKEVRLPGGSGLALEPGVKLMLSRLLHVKEGDLDGLDFTLYPWGVYLNLSFFR